MPLKASGWFLAKSLHPMDYGNHDQATWRCFSMDDYVGTKADTALFDCFLHGSK